MNLKNIVDDIKKYIDAEQVKNKIALDSGLKFKNNKCLCFLHSESNPSMSFDVKKKKFKCFSCGQNYDIFDHYQQYYNLSFLEALKSIVSDFNLNIDIIINETDRKPKKSPTKHENYNKNILTYCEKRNISKDTIDYVGVKENNNCVVFEYRNELGEHLANKYRKTKKSEGPKMWFEKGTNVNTLFNMDKINISEPLLITEGEFDCLSVIESGFKNAVSIPSGVNGTNEWITSNWTFIEQFEEIIIWFDNDEAGIKGAREVFNRLPNSSVKIVRCEVANDINELLHKYGKLAVLKQIEKASTPVLEGVATLDMIEDFDVHEAETLKTGIDYIDDKLVGMVFGSLNVLSGRNGSGKSTILNQIYIAEAINQGYKTFLFSGELIGGNVKYWLLQTLANEEQFAEYTAKDGHKYKKVTIQAKEKIVNDMKDRFFLYDSDDYRIETIIEKMTILAKRYGVRIFVIDNLMTVESSVKDKYEAETDIVTKLKNFAKKYNSIVHLVAHPRKSMNDEIEKDDVAGSANITNLADYVTTISRAKDEEVEYDAILKILKNRHTGVNVGKKLMFSIERKRFYSAETEKELNKRYLDLWEEVQGTWED
uniref:DNA directed DNA polymerase n=1 Tax=Siphoviridae sp. ctcx61 TaxID=2825575 RepID=A0A8S5TWI8_9CAUD|nr:MAG TPA: DNA directed DNA polymerase [Siphoviridae sp. ctcx61]